MVQRSHDCKGGIDFDVSAGHAIRGSARSGSVSVVRLKLVPKDCHPQPGPSGHF